MPPELQPDGGGKGAANGSARTGRRRLPNLAAIYGPRRGRTDSQRPLNDSNSNDSSTGPFGGSGT